MQLVSYHFFAYLKVDLLLNNLFSFTILQTVELLLKLKANLTNLLHSCCNLLTKVLLP